jgi:hypothetical protein
LVEAKDPRPEPGMEALAAGFFSEDDLPPLAPSQIRRIPILFRILRGEIPRPYFDGRVGLENFHESVNQSRT